jgi:hypothetical protein
LAQLAAAPQEPPVLAFPEPGLDDPASFQGYQTRFHRDAAGNVVQIYLDARSGRVVHLWADAENESLGFTARDTLGAPTSLQWATTGATANTLGSLRRVGYGLSAPHSAVDLGGFLLGTMRVERDYQYSGAHQKPFGELFAAAEFEALVSSLERLDPGERRAHLDLLGAREPSELRARLRPQLALEVTADGWIFRAARTELDGRTQLVLELTGDARTHAELRANTLRIRARDGGPLRFGVLIGTNASPLSPLRRADIFNAAFLAYHARAQVAHDAALSANPTATNHPAVLHYRRQERQVRGVELLAYREKLMAGLPNFATYFGRDMLMSALLMEPIWADDMLAHAVASALAKIRPDGQVSHEEAIGGQAIRESASEYVALVTDWQRVRAAGDATRADSALSAARVVLTRLRAPRENYMMRDDDFQFPVVAARFLANPRVAMERKRAFLREPAAPGSETRLIRLLRNLDYVARAAEPYARNPSIQNLIGFPRRTDTTAWFPGSWRDSGAGYAGGRFAYDVNAVWVPAALDACARILDVLVSLGITASELPADVRAGPLAEWLRDRSQPRRAANVWRATGTRFVVRLSAPVAAARVSAKLAWLPSPEAGLWRARLPNRRDSQTVTYLALALDSAGAPIPVMSTDPATRLFLEAMTATGPPDNAAVTAMLRDLRTFTLPYPAGLYVAGLGPVVANDAYAPATVWERFDHDRYHSPRVVWGREVNLILAGLAGQLDAATDTAGRPIEPRLAPLVSELERTLRAVAGAAQASGLGHVELWSYRIENGRLDPIRYGSSTDVQLWNLTDLAVQYTMPDRARIGSVR